MIFDAVTTLATVPAIVAIVNWLKALGLPPRGALFAAVLLGVGINIAGYVWADAGWFTVASSGLLLGLGASGIYDLTPAGPAPRRAVAQDLPITIINNSTP